MPSAGDAGAAVRAAASTASRSRSSSRRRRCCRRCRTGRAGRGRGRTRARTRRRRRSPARPCSRRSSSRCRRSGRRRTCCTAGPVGADVVVERVPAVAPDGVGALRAAAGLLALAGVDDLEVVDVAVRLVEVAVAVGVVAIPDVELRQVGVDLRRGLAGRDLRVVPGVGRVAHEQPNMRTCSIYRVTSARRRPQACRPRSAADLR